jgi:long-chain acyl-CoA synthetase
MANLYNFIHQKCQSYIDKTFLFSSSGEELTYKDLLSNVQKNIEFLGKDSAYVNSAHFSIIAPNCANYLYHLFAFLNLGFTAVNLNPKLLSYEIQERLNLGEVSIVITNFEIYEKIKYVLSKTGVKKILIIDENNLSYVEPKIITLNNVISVENTPNSDIAFLQFTGGTTGVTKAAMINHRQVIDNVEQLSKHIGSYTSLENLHVLIAFPFYHIFSIVFNVLFFMRNAGTSILYQDLQDTGLIISLLKKHPINFTVAVNTWYKKLMHHADFENLDTSKIKISLAGGEYVPLNTKHKWQALTGKPLFSAYGLTETCSLAIASPFDKTNEDDSIGIPLPDTEVVLLDEQNKIILANNQAGELALKGPQVAKGYYNNPEETKKAFYKEWFKTGDIAERINGQLYKIVDRKKDMISVSGNKVYPNEVEEVISKLKDVLDVGVVAKNSEISGEAVAACIVIKEGSQLQDKEIIDYCGRFLSRYKIPKHIFRYKELPKTAIGKTARRILKKEINDGNN